ncbi:MAG TPA: hypothetical protein VFJ16_05620 [Longimicrobium sp.]|nr:hypothetical protein [Longimicrobium sp.]
MFRVLKLFALAFATLLVTSACTGRGNDAPRPHQETAVRIDNQAWLDVTVYAVSSGQRSRLGDVTAHATRTFRIPESIVGLGRDLQFLVDPVGSNAQGTSFSIYVTPGTTVNLTVPPQFAR